LEQALASNQIEETLKSLLPVHASYKRLRSELERYRRIAAAGGWSLVPGGPKLKKGDRSDRMAVLRQRLFIEGYPTDFTVPDKALFDEELEAAFQKFQIQNGLEPDGVLGVQSLGALNISAEARVRQIVVNMERWRWLKKDLGSRYVLVNIAGFYLDVIDSGQSLLNMRVVTGKTYRRTPVFSDKIRYVVMNPFWHVPTSIALKDLVPKIKADPAFLSKQGFKVFDGWGGGAKELDPAGIDWQNIAASIRNLRFRQDPGPVNALGRIKFMFPNPHNVYLHDTPARELFGRSRRDFSSGCIRIEKPVDLAVYLLRNHPDWPPEKIRAALTGIEINEQTIQLPEPIDVHILYWTAWVTENGRLHFAPDIYHRDKGIDAAMQAPPPRP
jgi:murein L,D-transpeptidase YcbB/YkuD